MNTQQLSDGIKLKQKEIIKEIDRICRKNGLRYYLAYGTLIGAVRHNGFIPWDDDIDIMMPYSDMMKFASICKEELDSQKFFYQSPQTDEDYALTINRVRMHNTTMLEENMVGKKAHSGIFVDIYPLYGSAKQGFKRKLQIVRAMLRALYLLDEPVSNHGALYRIGSKILLKLKTKNGKIRVEKKLFEKISRYDFDESEFVTALDSGVKEMSTDYRQEWFSMPIDCVFDELSLYAPKDSANILKTYYGDYMTLPPENERKYHHNYVQIFLDKGNEK